MEAGPAAAPAVMEVGPAGSGAPGGAPGCGIPHRNSDSAAVVAGPGPGVAVERSALTTHRPPWNATATVPFKSVRKTAAPRASSRPIVVAVGWP